MKPSFFTLFKRGRYYRCEPESTEHDGEQTVVRVEQERFTAAAIAFCFEHSDEFYRHFWKNICGCVSPTLPSSKPTIKVEPSAWADLLIRGEIGRAPFAVVIECKVCAGLQDNQNPAREAFENPYGYGHYMMQELKGLAFCRYYVVLGYQTPLHLPDCHPTLGIRLSQKQWSDLAVGTPEDALVTDLFDSLGQIGVGAFGIWRFKNMKITTGLESVCGAFGVLNAAITKSEIRCAKPEIGSTGDGCCLGVYVKDKGATDIHEKLLRVTQSTTSYLAWFGYEVRPGAAPQRVIYLYCGTGGVTKALQKAIEKPGSGVSVREGFDEQPCVVIADAGTDEKDDIDWFSSNLLAVSNLSQTELIAQAS